MTNLSFIGLGLNSELGMTLQGLEIAKKADIVFMEQYTNLMPELNLKNLKNLLGREVKVLKRSDLEENAEDAVLKKAFGKKVALLVPGDPMIATTHVALRLQAEKAGIKTRLIHAGSIISAVAGVTGLQIYKFGRTMTIPFNDSCCLPESIHSFIKENQENELHTLALLDIDAEKGRYMTIKEAIEKLLLMGKTMRSNVIDENKLVIGLANIGSGKEKIKAARIKKLISHNFGSSPYSLVLPGKLHFLEREAIKYFCNAEEKDLEGCI